MVQKVFLTLRGPFLVLFLSYEIFGQFCFWAHQNLDAPCGSKSGLVVLAQCYGAAGEGEGKRFH